LHISFKYSLRFAVRHGTIKGINQFGMRPVMKCPKCGFNRQTEHLTLTPPTECPACGIVFAKFESSQPPENGADTQTTRSSPVDEQSLRKARARVEMRLRKNASQRADDHRSRTLELAKKLAEEGVRRRRAEWELRQRKTQAGAEEQQTEMKISTDPEHHVDPNPQSAEAPSFGPVCENEAPQISEPERPINNPNPEMVDSLSFDRIEDKVPSIERNPVQPAPWQYAGVRLRRSIHHRPKAGRAHLWTIAAFLVLGIGLIGAVLSWTTIDNTGAGNPTNAMSAGGSPLALLLGFAYLATGVLGFAFFWVASAVNSRFKEISRLLQEQQWLPHEDPADS
jgi:hypothetical protein